MKSWQISVIVAVGAVIATLALFFATRPVPGAQTALQPTPIVSANPTDIDDLAAHYAAETANPPALTAPLPTEKWPTATATVVPTSTLTVMPTPAVCTGEMARQLFLLPQTELGLKYQPNYWVREPAEFLGVIYEPWPGQGFRAAYFVDAITAGETRTEQLEGYRIDLARAVYVPRLRKLPRATPGKTPDDLPMRSLWVATGFVDPQGAYHALALEPKMENNQYKPVALNRDQATATFQAPGYPISVGLIDDFVGEDKIDWAQCAAKHRQGYTDPATCALGALVEQRYNNPEDAFAQTAILPAGSFLFGWTVQPSSMGSSLDTFERIEIPAGLEACLHVP